MLVILSVLWGLKRSFAEGAAVHLVHGTFHVGLWSMELCTWMMLRPSLRLANTSKWPIAELIRTALSKFIAPYPSRC